MVDDSDRYLFITCNLMKNKGLPLNTELLSASSNVYTDFFNTAREYLGNEAKDLGGNFVAGGVQIDDYSLKSYTRMLLDDAYSFLKDSDGRICRDVAHFAIAREVLRGKGREDEELKKISALGLISCADYMRNMITVLSRSKTKNKGVFKPNIYQSLNDFSCVKHPFVFDRYMVYLTTPKGFDSYIYEPSFIAPMMFLTSVCDMPLDEAYKYINDSKNKGLLLSDVSLRTENRFSEVIYSGGVLRADGYFKSAYFKAFDKLKSVAGSERSVYRSIIKPQMLKFMGSVIKQINEDIAKNPDIRPEDCYVNHISPRRISVCMRSDLNISEVLPSVYNKFIKFNLREYNLINYVLGGEY